jgi:hypothetical protein
MVLKMIRRGDWSGRAEAQQRPRVSKLRAKGLSDYHSSEAVVEAARRGASEPNKRASLTKYLLKKRGDAKQLFARLKKRQKVARQRKAPRIKRKNAYSKLWGVVAEGRGDGDVDVDE